MKTEGVKSLVQEVLDSLPTPYTEDVIDEVFGAIETSAAWRRRYDSLCDELGKATVNAWGGYWIANALGKSGERQASAKRSTLIGSYSLLDTDAVPSKRKPNESEARELVYGHFHAYKADLPDEIRNYREELVLLVMDGKTTDEAFNTVSEFHMQGYQSKKKPG
ncbi:hypothetical protein [Caballeronia sp. Lep1P3]|uniref:hypothetical protein n=1 Tax=Caballeronia sp. Lep1P3 TaxID=2878150 RepID=UPI001FD4CEB4|nr:hypothetical protein [Caballeronia sp. Lep1P3]